VRLLVLLSTSVCVFLVLVSKQQEIWREIMAMQALFRGRYFSVSDSGMLPMVPPRRFNAMSLCDNFSFKIFGDETGKNYHLPPIGPIMY